MCCSHSLHRVPGYQSLGITKVEGVLKIYVVVLHSSKDDAHKYLSKNKKFEIELEVVPNDLRYSFESLTIGDKLCPLSDITTDLYGTLESE